MPLGSAFDPNATGTLRGRVTWAGPVPALPAVPGFIPAGDGYAVRDAANPFAPEVDAPTRGLSDALVYLVAVDPKLSRPWDVPPVVVAMEGYRFRPKVAVCRLNAPIRVESRDPELHALRARGEAYFTLPFPAPNRPTERVLTKRGLVEFTSGAGYFWMAADVWVSEHPYAAVTDAQGGFELPLVPEGSYDLVCQVRSWHVAGQERDPETGLLFRQTYMPPLTRRATVTVSPVQVAEQSWQFAEADFPPAPPR